MTRYLKRGLFLALCILTPWLLFWRWQPTCSDAYLITGYKGNDLIVVLGTYDYGLKPPKLPTLFAERKDTVHNEETTVFFFRGGKVLRRSLPDVGLHGLLQIDKDERILIHGGDVRREVAGDKSHLDLIGRIGESDLGEPLEVDDAWWRRNPRQRYDSKIKGVVRLADDSIQKQNGVLYVPIGGVKTKVRRDYSIRSGHQIIEFAYRNKWIRIDCPRKTISIRDL